MNKERTRKRKSFVDDLVAKRLILRRKMLKITQSNLANNMGISFQQIQKYEKATNCLSAGRLWQLSQLLDVPVDYFFEDLPKKRPINNKDPMKDINIIRLVKNYTKINPYYAKYIDNLLEAMSHPIISKKSPNDYTSETD